MAPRPPCSLPLPAPGPASPLPAASPPRRERMPSRGSGGLHGAAKAHMVGTPTPLPQAAAHISGMTRIGQSSCFSMDHAAHVKPFGRWLLGEVGCSGNQFTARRA